MKKGREEKTKFSKILPNNQIITACRIELRVQKKDYEWKINYDWPKIGYGVFVDLQKVLDTVGHCWQNGVFMGFVESQMIGLNPICLIIVSMYL